MDSGDREPRRRRLAPLAVAIFAFFSLGLYVVGRPLLSMITEREMSQDNIRASQQICLSFLPEIEAYKALHGVYPECLEHAITAPIPPPVAGAEKWEYRPSEDRQAFTIRFGRQLLRKDALYPSCTFNSKSNDWSFDF